ncbi:peptide-methionine (R)-S-oxide reductase MsrB [Balneola sp. MJW-20]|uniref:peptide-methionine (R)-S-oxide reductase MsrB n=1 Tax=Gracilimonas aurantiaca TaxID=3234185 RepID=UPI003465FC61
MKSSILAALPILLFALLTTGASEEKESHSHKLNHTDQIPMTSFSVADFSKSDTTDTEEFPFKRSEAEWKQILTSKEYRILREKGTELPYVNEYNDNKRNGIYVCAACGQELYSSEHKYNSGTGWPSFWQPISDTLVTELVDNSWFMTRTEIVCSNCGSHIGHVFDDGPQPTGLRYCMNSVAMDFIPREQLNSQE